MVMARTAFGSGTINGVLALCGGEEIGGAANLMPRHLTYRSASSAGTTRDIWTDSLLNQICLLRRNPFKLDDPSTNVDSQIQPSAVNQGGPTLSFKCGKEFNMAFAVNPVAKNPLKQGQGTP